MGLAFFQTQRDSITCKSCIPVLPPWKYSLRGLTSSPSAWKPRSSFEDSSIFSKADSPWGVWGVHFKLQLTRFVHKSLPKTHPLLVAPSTSLLSSNSSYTSSKTQKLLATSPVTSKKLPASPVSSGCVWKLLFVPISVIIAIIIYSSWIYKF